MVDCKYSSLIGCSVPELRASPHRLPSRGHTPPFDHAGCSPAMHKSCVCVNFIAEHTRAKEDATKVSITEENSGNVLVTTF